MIRAVGNVLISVVKWVYLSTTRFLYGNRPPFLYRSVVLPKLVKIVLPKLWKRRSALRNADAVAFALRSLGDFTRDRVFQCRRVLTDYVGTRFDVLTISTP